MNTIQQIQSLLKVDSDGVWGPRSQAALDALIHPTKPDDSWSFINLSVDGNDIVIKDGIVTAFGGASDTMDSGETASGLSTKDNPSFIGCALPMCRDTSPALRGSPIPKLPWKTIVIFSDDKGNQVSTKLIDEGPAKWTRHAGDLTVAAAKLFDENATANNFEKKLDIRIVGGAQYLG
jgi:hypothetical protein